MFLSYMYRLLHTTLSHFIKSYVFVFHSICIVWCLESHKIRIHRMLHKHTNRNERKREKTPSCYNISTHLLVVGALNQNKQCKTLYNRVFRMMCLFLHCCHQCVHIWLKRVDYILVIYLFLCP